MGLALTPYDVTQTALHDFILVTQDVQAMAMAAEALRVLEENPQIAGLLNSEAQTPQEENR